MPDLDKKALQGFVFFNPKKRLMFIFLKKRRSFIFETKIKRKFTILKLNG